MEEPKERLREIWTTPWINRKLELLHSSDFDHARNKIGFKKEKKNEKLPLWRCFISLFTLYLPQHRSFYHFVHISAFTGCFSGQMQLILQGTLGDCCHKNRRRCCYTNQLYSNLRNNVASI